MGIKALEQAIKQKRRLYLYGAGIVARGACRAIRTLYDYLIDGYVVTDMKDNPSFIQGIPVIALSELPADGKGQWLLITVPEQYHMEIAETLRSKGSCSYDFLDANMEYELMGAYLKQTKNYKTVEDIIIPKDHDPAYLEYQRRGPEAYIGMAISIHDIRLKKFYQEPEWVHKIQVGAALTRERIAKNTDDSGNLSISEQNPRYGELTAAYWIWKTVRERIVGLYHYRRVLEIQAKELYALETGMADVILPFPFVCEPDTSEQYGRYLLDSDVEIMKQVLREKDPKHWEAIENALKGECLYNYNILVARKEVFHDYCSWMFPMLQEIDVRCGEVTGKRYPRYIGRIGEVLTALYFLVNWNHWNIFHGKKVWRT